MSLQPVVIDTNLLVLLVVGRADERFIQAHKRTRSRYSPEDYADLIRLIGERDLLLVPHVLAETSNFLFDCQGPMQEMIADTFAEFIGYFREHNQASREVLETREFRSKGLTDAVLLRVCASGGVLLTHDVPLFEAALQAGVAAKSFAHIQEDRFNSA